jgi:hypoxanthine-guanine phosphoribosyltransferase
VVRSSTAPSSSPPTCFERDPNPVRLDCIRISSYRNSTKSHGKPQLLHSLTLDIANRHVLLIDDILDTGKTFPWS